MAQPSANCELLFGSAALCLVCSGGNGGKFPGAFGLAPVATTVAAPNPTSDRVGDAGGDR